jgi:predicted nucleic acid-binding protein
MTLFLDSSALVKRYVAEEGSEVVLRRMDDDREWVVSAVARTEVEITLCRLGFEPDQLAELSGRLRRDWERCHVVPVDPACLDRAAEIGCQYQVRTLDAVHLAAADRLPAQSVVLTFDQRQAEAARMMDLTVEGA